MAKKRFAPIISYPIALAVGAGVGFFAIPKSNNVRGNMADSNSVKRERQNKPGSSGELIDSLIADQKAEAVKNQSESGSVFGSSTFDELSDSLAPAADPAAAFSELLKQAQAAGIDSQGNVMSKEQAEILAMLGVRYSQWMMIDTKAALALYNSDDPLTVVTVSQYGTDALEKVIAAKGLRSVLSDVPDVSKVGWAFAYQAAQVIGTPAGREDLMWLIENRPDVIENKSFQSAGYVFGGKWPLDERDALLGLLKGRLCADSMLAIAKRMDGSSGVDWIKSWIDSGTLDAEAMKRLGGDGTAQQLSDKTGLSISERVNIIRQLGAYQGTDDKRLKAQLISGQLHEFLTSDADWLYAFRHGAVSANDVYTAALAALPDPGDAKPELRTQIFRHLSEDDLGTAIKLLDAMTDDQKEWQKIWGAQWWFNGVNPDQFAKVVSSVSCEGDGAKETALKSAWRNKASENLERFGEDYLTWAKALPEGKNRAWALESIQQASKAKYPWINQEVTNLLEGQP